jgi:hypothetical protein
LSPHCAPRTHEIDTVTIHCVVGQCTAEFLGTWFSAPATKASSNYGIDKDGRIGLYVPESYRSICSSSSANDNRAITIEVASDTFAPYAVTNAAYNALIDLLVDICQRNPGIGRLRWCGDKSLIGQVDKQNMTVHRWFIDKECPGEFLYNLHNAIAAEVNQRLEHAEDEDFMGDINKFEHTWLDYRKTLQDNDASSYSEDARNWAVSTGLITGSGDIIDGAPNYMWGDVLSREQLVTILYRFAKMLGKA